MRKSGNKNIVIAPKMVFAGILLLIVTPLPLSLCAQKSLCKADKPAKIAKNEIFVQRRIEYGRGARLYHRRSRPLYFDLYEPATIKKTPRPLVIALFGGGYVVGNRHNAPMTTWCPRLAEHGYMAAAIDYRLMNIGKLNGSNILRAGYLASHDVVTAVQYFKQHGSEYNIDTSKIFLLGNSAGATAIIHALYMDEDERPSETFFPENLPAMSCQNPDIMVAGAVLLWGCISDPAMITPDEQVPLCMIHGENDRILPIDSGHAFSLPLLPKVYGSQAIARQLIKNGQTDFSLHLFKGEPHAFYFKYIHNPNARLFRYLYMPWLNKEKFEQCFQIAVDFLNEH